MDSKRTIGDMLAELERLKTEDPEGFRRATCKAWDGVVAAGIDQEYERLARTRLEVAGFTSAQAEKRAPTPSEAAIYERGGYVPISEMKAAAQRMQREVMACCGHTAAEHDDIGGCRECAAQGRTCSRLPSPTLAEADVRRDPLRFRYDAGSGTFIPPTPAAMLGEALGRLTDATRLVEGACGLDPLAGRARRSLDDAFALLLTLRREVEAREEQG